MKKITIHTDGAARGNPGPSAIAYVITDNEGWVIEHGQTIGETTNNQAEYQAMKAACNALVEQNLTECDLQFYSDSELMVKQLKGEYRVKDVNLQPHFLAIQACLQKLRSEKNEVSVTAVRRMYNKRADELANSALDGTL